MLSIMNLAPVAPAYVQVNIGRNVDGTAMGPGEWSRFKGAVESAVENATIGRGVVSTHTGRGAWLSENGNTVESEDSAYISTFAVVDVPALRAVLACLREIYEQDAIALIVGSELI